MLMHQMRPLKFAHLHAHSGYSLFDGQGTCERRAQVALQNGQNYLALTDHMQMSGIYEHWKACNELGINPILGLEAYFMMQFQAGKEFVKQRRHITLLAMNQKGYQSLCHIMTESIQNFYQKQVADLPILKKWNEGVICLSGCVLGEIPHQIINDNMDEARRVTEQFLNIYGDRFYFELQPQNFPDQRKANEGIIKLCQEFDVDGVMTNDAHYPWVDGLDSYMLYRKIGRNEVDEIETQNIREQYKELYLCTSERMSERWYDLMGTDGYKYIENSQKVAERTEPINLIFEEKVPEFSEYDEQGNKISNHQILMRKTKEGMKRLGLYKQPYIDRVKYELSIIIPKKTDYYLLVADMVDWAKKHGVHVGPGRGSGAASAVAYFLGITGVDPIEWDLMFERFINPERITLPDFDIDFSSRKYKKLIAYLSMKYNGQIAHIVNIIKDKGDNLINDLGKVLSMTKEEIEMMKTQIGRMGYKENQPEYAKIMQNPLLADLEDRYKVITHFCTLFGNPRAFSQHASGVVILHEDISNYIPLFARGSADDRTINTSYHKVSLAEMNIVKVDALKLDTVDIVYDCAKITGVPIESIPLHDQKTMENFKKLNLGGIFQFDTPTGSAIIKEVSPDNVYEVAAATSLNRPGSSNMGMVKVYKDGKAGRIDKNTLLYKYCSKTYGALIYQEQVMMACIDIAKMSWGDASKVMKSLFGLPEDHPLTIKFVEGAMKHSGLTRKEALDLIMTITQYTFNAGHAAAYSMLSYWSMWYKVYYPKEFYLCLLRAFIRKEKRIDYEADAVRNRLPIFIPHVNGQINYHFFHPVPNEIAIRSGLLTIDGLGQVAAKLIEEERKENGDYTSEEEFIERVNKRAGRRAINKRNIEALRAAGALEFDFSAYRKLSIEYNRGLINRKNESRKFYAKKKP